MYYSGLWQCTELQIDGTVWRTMHWVLTLTPQTSYPSAFGASVNIQHTEFPEILQGTWKPESMNSVVLKRVNAIGEEKQEIRYIGNLAEIQGQIMITGIWDDHIGRSGHFACVMEDSEGHHVSGLWVGNAVPDVSLAEFFIPTNPIRWSLSMIVGSEQDEKPSQIFGCGYFDDSADIPNQPLLFYILHAKRQGQDQIEFVKIYESAEQTEGYDINYSGSLSRDQSGNWSIEGNWRNAAAYSHGQFVASMQDPELATGHICLCSVCNAMISPGSLRYSCSECVNEFTVCEICYTRVQHEHSESLTADVLYKMDVAEGSCCSQLIWDALNRFSERAFVGYRNEIDAQFSWITYGQIRQHCLNFVSMFQLASRDFVVFLADTSVPYICAMLGTLMSGCIVVPLHGAFDTAALAQILCDVQPVLCVVDDKYMSKLEEATSSANLNLNIKLCQINSESIENNDFSIDGTNRQDDWKFDPVDLEKNEVSSILYTSGSTGRPKGAMFSEDLMVPAKAGSAIMIQPFVRLDFQNFDPSFVLSLLSTLQMGGSRALSPNLQTIMQDLQLVRPTHLGASPVFWNSLYHIFQRRLKEELMKGSEESRDKLERRLGMEIRRLLGNRLHVATSGGAALSVTVKDFITTLVGIDLVDLYGSRETGGIARNGIVYPNIDVILLPRPDLGYDSSNQGEICIASPRLISGYFKNDELNSEKFIDREGKRYYKTGDLGEGFIDQNGKYHVRILDRASFVFKLAQGEWISPSRIEEVLEQHDLVDQALVMGSSIRTYTVAVIVPSDPNIEISVLNSELRFWCRHHRLRPFEIPQVYHIELNKWTEDQGLVTSTQKKRRGPLNKQYKDLCRSLYDQVYDVDEKEIQELSEEFVDLLKSILPALSHLNPQTTFAEIGGDSLAASRLINVLRERNINLTMENLFEYPLRHLSDMISRHVTAPALETNWSFNMWNITLPELNDNDIVDEKREECILITGCTGFVGPVLLGEILCQYPSKVYCLVRGKDQQDSESRLNAHLDAARIEEDWSRVEVLCGDLSMQNFGLSQEKYQELVDSTTVIYHNGAIVNLSLPYSALQRVNVQGTVSIIELANSARARIIFVSTIGAMPAGGSTDFLGRPMNAVDMAKKEGYGQTKALCEWILYRAIKELHLDVRMIRPSAISVDSRTGYGNKVDFTHLLILACLSAQATPLRRSDFTFKWIPVDFVAQATVALGKLDFQCGCGKVLNLFGIGTRLSSVLESLRTRHHAAIEDLGPKDWKQRVLQNLVDGHPAVGIKSFIDDMKFHDATAEDQIPLELIENSRIFLEKTCNLQWPQVDMQQINYIADLVWNQFLSL